MSSCCLSTCSHEAISSGAAALTANTPAPTFTRKGARGCCMTAFQKSTWWLVG